MGSITLSGGTLLTTVTIAAAIAWFAAAFNRDKRHSFFDQVWNVFSLQCVLAVITITAIALFRTPAT